jgi:hypothetical protein
MLTAEAKQKAFDHCLRRSGFPDGIGVGTTTTLTTLFGCMRIRLQAENATKDELKAFAKVIAQAIQDDPTLARKDRADENAELQKLLQAAFDQVPYIPLSPPLLAASVSFLSRVRF